MSMPIEEQVRTALLLVTDKMSFPDKAGLPSYLHAIRVGCSYSDPTLMTIGFLHDIVEDTDVTLMDLEEMGFSEDVVLSVHYLTHIKNESHEIYVQNIVDNDHSAAMIKLADVMDNMTRVHGLEVLNTLPKEVTDRMTLKYEKALRILHKYFLGLG